MRKRMIGLFTLFIAVFLMTGCEKEFKDMKIRTFDKNGVQKSYVVVFENEKTVRSNKHKLVRHKLEIGKHVVFVRVPHVYSETFDLFEQTVVVKKDSDILDIKLSNAKFLASEPTDKRIEESVKLNDKLKLKGTWKIKNGIRDIVFCDLNSWSLDAEKKNNKLDSYFYQGSESQYYFYGKQVKELSYALGFQLTEHDLNLSITKHENDCITFYHSNSRDSATICKTNK